MSRPQCGTKVWKLINGGQQRETYILQKFESVKNDHKDCSNLLGGREKNSKCLLLEVIFL